MLLLPDQLPIATRRSIRTDSWHGLCSTVNVLGNVHGSGGGLTTLQKLVTIGRVAREAGVSVQTISRVINNRPDVAPATRQRVQQVIAQLLARGQAFSAPFAQNDRMAIGAMRAARSGPASTARRLGGWLRRHTGD
jgi:hypothetical protein